LIDSRLSVKVDSAHLTKDGQVILKGIEMDPDKIEAEKAALESIVSTLKSASTSAGKSLRLSAAIQQFAAEKKSVGCWTAKTEDEILAALDLLVEVMGDQPIAELTREAAVSYRSALQRLPVNRSKDPLYRGKSVAQILNMKAPAVVLSTASVNKALTRASALFEWAVQCHYVPSNIFKSTQLKTGKADRERRVRFSAEEVRLVLAGLPKDQPSRYWIPYIAAYSGMRLNEICQLDVADIITGDASGFAAFSINDNSNNKKLKTLSSRRLVPVHQYLIYLGFLKYAEEMKEAGKVKLFPDLTYSKNGYADIISKWFARYRLKLGIAEDGPVFHSFRHTVADSLKQLKVDFHIIEDILGHSSGQSATKTTYTNQYTLDILGPELNKLSY